MRFVCQRCSGIIGLVLALVGCEAIASTFMQDAVAPWIATGELPGAISILYCDGRQETACMGYADPRTKRPIRLDDVFMQCSQTKGFCGVSVAMLVEEGRISLDDPVSKYLPEFAKLWVLASETNDERVLKRAQNELRVRMVMNHTGGFPYEMPANEWGGWAKRMPLRSIAMEAAALPLKFEPGTDCRYSNVGIDIGAAIVESVAQTPWDEFLERRIFKPLGMADTTFNPTDGQLARLIELHECVAGRPAKRLSYHPACCRPYNGKNIFPSAGGGLFTTASDQLKFYKMLMNLGVGDNGRRILREETVRNLLARSTRPPGMEGYSLGLLAPVEDGEDKWFGHGGAWGTQCMVNWHRKQLKLWVVQLTEWPRPWNRAKERAENAFFNGKIDNAGVDAYTGRRE